MFVTKTLVFRFERSIAMGISDLLPQLSSIVKRRPLSFYQGKRAAVDMLCW